MHIALNLGPQKQLNEDIEDNLKTEGEKIGDQNAEPTTVDAPQESPKKGDKKKKDDKEEKKEESKTPAPEEVKVGFGTTHSAKGTPPKEEGKQEDNVMIT